MKEVNVLTAPTRVTIVRPKLNINDQLQNIFPGLGGMFLTSWIVMLIVGAQTPWDLGYWQTVLITIAIRLTLPNRMNLNAWTATDKS